MPEITLQPGAAAGIDTYLDESAPATSRGSDTTAKWGWGGNDNTDAMFKFDLWGIVRPMVMTSESAARIFKDGILDLVFIDADHSYGSIKQDIELWLPKVKAGGILCGHDCEGYYTQYTEVQKKTFGDGNIEFVYIAKNVGIHPGVIKAVYDTLGSQYQIVPNSKVWYHKK